MNVKAIRLRPKEAKNVCWQNRQPSRPRDVHGAGIGTKADKRRVEESWNVRSVNLLADTLPWNAQPQIKQGHIILTSMPLMNAGMRS